MLPITAGFSTPQLIELARAADHAGLPGLGIGEFAGTEAMVLAGAVAVSTERIRIETGVISVLTRSPALLAMGASTVQHLAGGRFVLGIGAGSPIGAAYHGRPFERPLSNLGEVVEDIRAVARGEQLERWGSYRLTGVVPVPVPIYVSGINSRTLAFAARDADGIYLSLVSGVAGIRSAVDELRAASHAAGRTSFEIVAIQHGYTGHDPAAGELAFRHEIAPYFAVSTYRRAVRELASAEEVEAIAAAWSKGGRAAAAPLIPQMAVDSLYVAGGPDAFAKRLAEIGEAGADAVRFLPVRTGRIEETHSLIDVLAAAQMQHAGSSPA
jgi:5,10-methylenetetrahydromethanopterin reductase